MKLWIVLTLAVCSHGAKLRKGYLPPSYAQTSGGSGSFLQTPVTGLGQNNFGGNNGQNGPNDNGFAPTGNGLAPTGDGFAPTGSGIAPTGNGFAPTGNGVNPSGNGFVNDVSGFDGFNSAVNRPERPQAAFEKNAAIIRQYNNNDGESYSYGYETENGITAEEAGVATNGVEAQGGFSYTGDDGRVYSIRYTADQNGFRPVGDHLPTPPPIPEEILKALEQNARDEAAGIFDDGSYNAGKYGTSVAPNRAQPFSAITQGVSVEDDAIVTNNALILDNDAIRPPGYKNQLRNKVKTQNLGSRVQDNLVQGQSPVSPIRFQGNQRQPGFRGANKEYLPPFVQNNFGLRNPNGRLRPSFDEKNGYKY